MTSEAEAEVSLADIEAGEDEARERGYRGVADPRDREDYALTSGPDGPSTLETTLDAKRADLDAQQAEFDDEGKQDTAPPKTHTRKSSGSSSSASTSKES